MTINEMPEKIWLVVNPDGSTDDEGYPLDGVTWSDAPIGGEQYEYVRADLVKELKHDQS